jgi:hypothetical protein
MKQLEIRADQILQNLKLFTRVNMGRAARLLRSSHLGVTCQHQPAAQQRTKFVRAKGSMSSIGINCYQLCPRVPGNPADGSAQIP